MVSATEVVFAALGGLGTACLVFAIVVLVAASPNGRSRGENPAEPGSPHPGSSDHAEDTGASAWISTAHGRVKRHTTI